MLIYKILLPGEWARFESAGDFAGTSQDEADGFVHCSSQAQLGETVRRFFSPDQDLVVVGVDAEALGGALHWELAPDRGEPFPHVYGVLPRDAVRSVHRLAPHQCVDDVIRPV